MRILGIHPYHDANVAVAIDGRYEILELERLFGVRHLDWMHADRDGLEPALVTRRVRDYLDQNFPGDFDHGVVTHERTPDLGMLPVAGWSRQAHHRCHAAVAFYQSPFRDAYVLSYDGGGPDGYFRLLRGSYSTGVTYVGAGLPLNLGSAYAVLAEPIQEIQRRSRSLFPNAGKLMGLAAFGRPVKRWLPELVAFFRSTGNSAERLAVLPALGAKLGFDFSHKCLSGEVSADYAATCQQAFEDVLFSAIESVLPDSDSPVCLSGGCALNVTFNEKFASRRRGATFVPPNPNDCGLGLGAVLLHAPPSEQIDVTYCGMALVRDHPATAQGQRVTPAECAALLAQGLVIGVARGRSEHGPRALGHRSILADPAIPDLRDRLNRRIKYREPYRPYAPVTRAESARRFFNVGSYDSSFMSFAPTLRPEWHRLEAVRHVDNTARLQTVTASQNQWLHLVLTEFGRRTGYDVLVNTSFNVKGRPMVSSSSEALQILRETDLDAVLIEEELFTRAQ